MEIIIKPDHDEPVKVKTSSIYGEMSPLTVRGMQIIREELQKTKERYVQAEMDLQTRDEKLQDLKLENDRLKKRDAIMLNFVKSAYCRGMKCNNCLFFDSERLIGKKCIYNRNEIFVDISNVADDVLKELDNL